MRPKYNAIGEIILCNHCGSSRHNTDKCLAGFITKKPNIITTGSPGNAEFIIHPFKEKLIRVKLATTHRDLGKIYQTNFQHERNKIKERNKGRLNGTIILKKAGGLAKNMVHVWLIIRK